MKTCILILLPLAVTAHTLTPLRKKVVLTNDDGWAVANIRAQNDALRAAGFDVILSAPAENESGTGTSSAPPTVLTESCEFDTCPAGSPAEGFNHSDSRLNFVNSFPVDSVRFGINTLAPRFFHGSKPDFVVSGSNVGNNLGPGIPGSGTVGAATEATREGIPSSAFSAGTASQISYTTLANTSSPLTLAANLYAALTVKFVDALLTPIGPILPPNISLNVNYPAIDNCTTVDQFTFVLRRLESNPNTTDLEQCGTTHLPNETFIVRSSGGCFASVSVFDTRNITDADINAQRFVSRRLDRFLGCFHQ